MNGQNHGGKGSAHKPERFKMMQYVAMMEPRGDMLQDCEAFIFEAMNLSDAKAKIAEKDFPNHYDVYIQSVNSLYLNHPERRNRSKL